jgi:hypothetical protein
MRLLRLFRSRGARPSVPQAQLRLETLEERLVPYTTSGNAWPHPQLVTLTRLRHHESICLTLITC